MRKTILALGVVLISLMLYTNVYGARTSEMWEEVSGVLYPQSSTWEVGSASTRLTKMYSTDIDTNNLTVNTAFTLTGTPTAAIDMDNKIITNIGNAGTDFTTSGGLTTAGGIATTIADTVNQVGLTVAQNDVTNNPRGATLTNAGTGNGLFIDQNGNGTGLKIDTDAITSSDRGYGIHLIGSGTRAQYGNLMYIYDNSASVISNGADATVFIQTNNANATTPVLKIQNDAGNRNILEFINAGTGNGNFFDQNGNGVSINIDSEATTANGIYGDFSVMTSGKALTLVVDSDVMTGKAIQVLGGADHATDVFSVDPFGSVRTNWDSITIATTQSPLSNAACTAGEIAWDASYVYICTASTVWKRAALTGGY